MSYDIRFAVKVAGADKDIYAVIGHPEYDTPTYNLRDIFVKCMDWDYDQGEWYRMDEVIPKIERGVHELAFHEKKYKPLEPKNGWGQVSSAMMCLQSILDWFKDPWCRGWNEDIPIECIYMAW